jgi:uncharacterized protein (TIGR02391 family)
MNLQTHIQPELWDAIAGSYEAANYKHSILDAVHYLSEVLREKANVDGDGVNLVGQALGGESPRIRINKLQTQSERDAQKGLQDLLKGFYVGIRNPRSHEQIQDSKETADAIILFLDYLVNELHQSEQPFTIEKFLKSVFDRDFVESERYADILTSEIPTHKHLDTLINIYRNKQNGDGEKLYYIIDAILKKLTDIETATFVAIVSDELKLASSDDTIRKILQLLPIRLWPQLYEGARLRIENKLIGYIRIAEAYPNDGITDEGALATWAVDFLPQFSSSMKSELHEVLVSKLEDTDSDDRRYILNYFSYILPTIIVDKPLIRRCIRSIVHQVKENDFEMIGYFESRKNDFPEAWEAEFKKQLPEYYVESSESAEDLPF